MLTHPISGALISYFATESYKNANEHNAEQIAADFGIEQYEVVKAIETLTAVGLFEKQNGKYQSTEMVVDIRSAEEVKRLYARSYWNEKIWNHDRNANLNQSKQNHMSSFVYTFSSKAKEKIIESIVKCYNEIDSILYNDEGEDADEVWLCSLDLMQMTRSKKHCLGSNRKD